MSEITHSLVPRTKIDACCDKDATRYALNNVEIIPAAEPGTVYCTATNGRVATVALAEGTATGPALLPAKFSKVGKPVSLNGEWRSENRVAAQGEGRFPRCDDVFPKVPASSGPDGEPSGYAVLELNGYQMKMLADAIGHEGWLTFFVPPNGENGYVNQPIACRGTHGIGVIMPATPGNGFLDRYETTRLAYAAARLAAHQPPEVVKQPAEAA